MVTKGSLDSGLRQNDMGWPRNGKRRGHKVTSPEEVEATTKMGKAASTAAVDSRLRGNDKKSAELKKECE